MPNDTKNHRPTVEEENFRDEIDREYEYWDDLMFGVPMGYVPDSMLVGMDEDVIAAYMGMTPKVTTECSTASSPEEWREFLRKLEEDLDS